MDGRTDGLFYRNARAGAAEDYGNSCAAAATRYTPDPFLPPTVPLSRTPFSLAEERSLYLVTNG